MTAKEQRTANIYFVFQGISCFNIKNMIMRIKILFVTTMSLALSIKGNTQTLNKAKLDQFFDQLATKKQAMGSLVIVKDGKALYTRTIGYSQINETENKPL